MSERRSAGEAAAQRRTRSPGPADAEEGTASARAKLRKVGTDTSFSRVPGDPTQSPAASAAQTQLQTEGVAPSAPVAAAAGQDAGAQGEPTPRADPAAAALVQAVMSPVVIHSEQRFVCLGVRRVTLTPNLTAASLGPSTSTSIGYEVVVAALGDAADGSLPTGDDAFGRMRLAWKDIFMLHPDLGAALAESHVLRRGLIFTVVGRRVEVSYDTNKLAAAAFEALKAIEQASAAEAAAAALESSPLSSGFREPAAVAPAPFVVFQLLSRGFLQPMADATEAEVLHVLANPALPWHPACPVAAVLAGALRAHCEDPLAVVKAVVQRAGPVLCSRSLCESWLAESAVNEEASFKGLQGRSAEPLPFLPVAELRVAGVHDLEAPPPHPDIPVVILADPSRETLSAAVDCFRPLMNILGRPSRRTAIEKGALSQPALQVPLLGRVVAVSKLYYWAKPNRADRLPLRFSITLADETLSELQVQFWAHDASRYYAAMRALPLGSIVSIQGYRITEWAGKLEATVNTATPGPIVALVQPDEAAAYLGPGRLPPTPLLRLRFTPTATVLASTESHASADHASEHPPINVCGVVTRVGPWCRAPLGTDPVYEAGPAAPAQDDGSAAGAGIRAVPGPLEAAESAGGAGARPGRPLKAVYQSSRGLPQPLSLPGGTAAALQAALLSTVSAGAINSSGNSLLARAAEPLQAVADAAQVLERLRLTSGTLGNGPGKGRFLAWRWVWITDETSATSVAVKLYDGSQAETVGALAPGAPVALYRVKAVSVPSSRGGKSLYLVSTPLTSVFAGVAGAPFSEQPDAWQHAVATDVGRVQESIAVHARLPPSAQRPPLSVFVFGLQRLQHWAEAAWQHNLLLPASPAATALLPAAVPEPTPGGLPDDALAPVLPVAHPLLSPAMLLPSSLTRPASLSDYVTLLARAPLFMSLPAASSAAISGTGPTASWRTVPILSLRDLRTLVSYGAALRALTAASMTRRGALSVEDPMQGDSGFDDFEAAFTEQSQREGAAASGIAAATPFEAVADGPLTPAHLRELLTVLPTLQPGQLVRLVLLAKVVRIDASVAEEGEEGSSSVASPADAAYSSPDGASRPSPLQPWSTGGSHATGGSRRLSLPTFATSAEAGPSQAAERALLAAMSAAHRGGRAEAASGLDELAAHADKRSPQKSPGSSSKKAKQRGGDAFTSPASFYGGAGSAPGSLRRDNPLLASLATEEDVARALAELAAAEQLRLDEPDTPATTAAELDDDPAVIFSAQRRGRLRRANGELVSSGRRLSLDSAGATSPASQASDRTEQADPGDDSETEARGDSAGEALLQRLPLARGGRRHRLRDLSMLQAARALLPPPSRAQALADMHEDAGDAEWAADSSAAAPLYTLVVAGAKDASEAATLRLPLLPSALLPLSSQSGQPLPAAARAAARSGVGSDAPTPPVNGAEAVTPPVSGVEGALSPPLPAALQAAAEALATGVDTGFLQSVFPAAPPSHAAAQAAAAYASPATAFVASILQPDRVFAVCLTVQQQGLDLPAAAAGGRARAGRGQRRPVIRVEAVYDAPPALAQQP